MKNRMFLFLGILLSLLLSATALADIQKGPYVQRVTKSSAYISWETTSAAGGAVEWGPDDSFGNRVEAGSDTMHEVKLEGLESDTAYFYKVVGNGGESKTYHFFTAPKPSEPFRFIAYGDSRSGYSEHRRTVEAMMLENPSIVSNSGDLVCTGQDEDCWQMHFEITQDIFASVMLLPAIGNHDVDGGNSAQYKRYFNLPPVWSGQTDDHDEQYYYMDWGNTRFISLDCETAPLGPGSAQQNWLIQVLQDAKSNDFTQHIFVQVHVGPFSAKPDRSGNSFMRSLIDTFIDFGVTAVISGHDHHYYRGHSENGQFNFIVTGGGGASLYDCVPKADYGVVNESCEKVNHYVIFDIDGPHIDAVVKSTDGSVLDEFSWESRYDKVVASDDDDDDTVNPNDDDDDSTGLLDDDDDDGGLAPSGDQGSMNAYDPEYGFAGCQMTVDSESIGSWSVAALLLGLFGLLRRNTRRRD